MEGDPTEAALLAAVKARLIDAEVHRESPRIDMIPFDSEHMFRATFHEAGWGRVIYALGAAERLLDRCSHSLADDGRRIAIDKEGGASGAGTDGESGLAGHRLREPLRRRAARDA